MISRTSPYLRFLIVLIIYVSKGFVETSEKFLLRGVLVVVGKNSQVTVNCVISD